MLATMCGGKIVDKLRCKYTFGQVVYQKDVCLFLMMVIFGYEIMPVS